VTAAVEYATRGRTSRMGRSSVTIVCPCCGTECEAYVWSLAGSGKRCPNPACRALHCSLGTYPNKIPAAEAKTDTGAETAPEET
jgi:hypothetical protein